MLQSSNRHFHETAEFILNHRDNIKDLVIEPRTPDFLSGKIDYQMGFDYQVRDGKLTWILQPTVPMVLGDPAPRLASQFTHETEHIRDLLERLFKLQGLLPEDQVKKLKIDVENNWVAIESRTYGVQAQSAILHYALTKEWPGKSALDLIRCRSDIKSSCWRDFVDRNFVSRVRAAS